MAARGLFFALLFWSLVEEVGVGGGCGYGYGNGPYGYGNAPYGTGGTIVKIQKEVRL